MSFSFGFVEFEVFETHKRKKCQEEGGYMSGM